jgi:hypothetical protein
VAPVAPRRWRLDSQEAWGKAGKSKQNMVIVMVIVMDES